MEGPEGTSWGSGTQLCFLASPCCSWTALDSTLLLCLSQTPSPATLAPSQRPRPAQPRDLLRGNLHSRHASQGSLGAFCLQNTQT